ncbi:PQ loop repeat protein [Penicillium manginii]|uniref:PQ loop repeat protein n=1 Tax=Penicillium manginii TaxID=203109 RepID=UPI002548C0D2|nr:PQ loop repeat protein [Penicillium manginii]KAJ5741762.1 PQ loop repeat protein [Penicillium manginii]
MESGEDNRTATILGTIGTVFWCIQLVPQIWYNWRRKKTEGLPVMMGFLWAGSDENIRDRRCSYGSLSDFTGIDITKKTRTCYCAKQKVNLPLQIQPQIFGFFSTIIWAQILYYNHNYSKIKATLVCCGLLALLGGLEALLVLTLRIPYEKGITWPDLVVGIVAAIMLGAGIVPVYFELWKREGRVVGFNWVFLCIDTLGGLFSLFALAAEGSFDILGGIMYIIVYDLLHFFCFSVVLEMGIYISHTVWRYRFRKLRKEAKESGKSIDEILERYKVDSSSSSMA